MTGQPPAAANEAFSIRGHHLPSYNALLLSHTPDSMAAGMRAYAEIRRGGNNAATIDFADLNGNSSTPRYDAAYGFDLIGDTTAQADQFEELTAATMQTFLELPNDAPVRLTTTPDELCGSCTFKQHCQLPRIAQMDKQVLGVFEDITGHLAASDEQLTSAVMAKNAIHTDARTVRAFMGYMATEKNVHGTFYADAVRARERFGHVLGPGAATARGQQRAT